MKWSKKCVIEYMKIITEQEKLQIVELFNNGKTVKEIMMITTRSKGGVTNILRSSGISPRKSDRFKYQIKKEFIENINSENFLYFLGLLMSDGYLFEKTDTLTIDLMRGDSEILEKLAHIIYEGDSYKIKTYKTEATGFSSRPSEKYRLQIKSKELCVVLKQIGVHQNKSFSLEWPNIEITPSFLNHFIRGMIDGDGCLSEFKKSDSFCVHLINSVPFCEKMKIKMAEIGFNFKIKYENNHSQPMATLWLFGRNQSKLFLDWLYRDSTLFLRRKYEKYQNLIINLNAKRLKLNKKGYVFHKHSGLYLVNISRTIDGKKKLLYSKYFKTPEEAHENYLKQSKIIYETIDFKNYEA